MNIQCWLPLELMVWSLCTPRDSQVFSSTTVQKHQCFGSQPSLWSSSHVHLWLLEKRNFDYMGLCWQSHFSYKEKASLISQLQAQSAVILEPKRIKSVTVSIVPPSICHEVMGLDAMILVFWMLSFKPAFSCSSFTFIKRCSSSYSFPNFEPISWSMLSSIFCFLTRIQISQETGKVVWYSHLF